MLGEPAGRGAPGSERQAASNPCAIPPAEAACSEREGVPSPAGDRAPDRRLPSDDAASKKRSIYLV